MLDRFTDTAKDIITDVKDLALSLKHDALTNEHILYVFLNREDCLARQLIIERKPIWELMRRDLNTFLVPKRESGTQNLNFDESTKKSIERAFHQIEKLDFKWISSGAILLGMFECGSERTQQLLRSWGLEFSNLRDRLIEIGDSPTSKEHVPFLPARASKILEMSTACSDDLNKVLTHAMELARTYDNAVINFYHLFLSYVFLTVRNVIDVSPFDINQFKLDAVKEIVADKMSSDNKLQNDLQTFSYEIHKMFHIAIQEAYQMGHTMVGIPHMTIGMAYAFPNEIQKGTGYSYTQLKWLLLEATSPAVSSAHKEDTKDGRQMLAKEPVYAQISLRRYNADKSAVIMIPRVLAEEWGVLALDCRKDVLTVAMLDPENEEVIQKLRELTQMRIAIVKTEERDLRAAYKINY